MRIRLLTVISMGAWSLILALPPSHAATPTSTTPSPSPLAVATGSTTTSAPSSPLPSIPWPTQPWSGQVDLSHNAPSEGLSGVCRQLLLSNLPETLEDTKKWGGTQRRWDGLKVHREGLQIKTKRRWKEVNHGLWQMYRITPRDPDQNLQLRITDLHETAPGIASFQIHLEMPLDALARRARWHQGVQLFSISIEAEATVVLDAQVELKSKLDPTHFPPDVVFLPRVTQAQLHLRDYKVHRISKLKGDIAEEIGDAMEGILQQKIEDKQQKIVDRMNRQIEKNQAKLRLSLYEMGQWFQASKSTPSP